MYHSWYIMWCWCQCITWPKMSCCTSFWLHDLRNAMVLWQYHLGHMILMPQYHQGYMILMPPPHNTGTSGVTWPKCHVSPSFDLLDIRNAMVSLMMMPASHDADPNANGILGHWWQRHHRTKKSCDLDCLNLRNAVVPLRTQLAWCYCWWQWCHMTRKVMFYLILIILT